MHVLATLLEGEREREGGRDKGNAWEMQCVFVFATAKDSKPLYGKAKAVTELQLQSIYSLYMRRCLQSRVSYQILSFSASAEMKFGEIPTWVKERPVEPWGKTFQQNIIPAWFGKLWFRGFCVSLCVIAVFGLCLFPASRVPFNPAERGLPYILSAPLIQFWWRSKQYASSRQSMHALSIMSVAFCCTGKYIAEIKKKGSSKAKS